jgi:YD repeat-containing protein
LNFNLISITDAEDRVTTYDYDDLNRRYKETFADSGVREVEFDAAGGVTEERTKR